MHRATLENAAAKYSYLRGLFSIPLGLLFVLAALGNWQVGPLREPWVFVVVALAIGATCLPISRYYNDHYGRLSPSDAQQARLAVALVASVAVMAAGSWAMRDLPVNGIAVCFSLVILLSYGLGVGLMPHHVLIWGGLLVAGALPVWTGEDPSNVGLVLAGAGVIASGILDHRLFVRTFGPPTVAGHVSA